MRIPIAICLCLIISHANILLHAQEEKDTLTLRIVSYNVENLFDYKHDSLKNDYEFLPDATRRWNYYKYKKKLDNIARAIVAIGEGNRFSPLWSVGLRYNLHHEKFFENDVITELALRGSYGYTGNIDRTAYPFATMALGSEMYEGNRFATEFTYPNPTVGWEKKQDRNLGIDLSLWDGRVNFTMDYYNNRTEDVLTTLTIPISTGRSSVRANGGIVKNTGLEFYLNIRWVNPIADLLVPQRATLFGWAVGFACVLFNGIELTFLLAVFILRQWGRECNERLRKQMVHTIY